MTVIKKNGRFILGMVHCLPLPGTPNFKENCDEIIDQAIQDAKTLAEAGVDGIVIENMGDTPFGVKLDIAQITALSAVTGAITQHVDLPIGIDAALNDYETSIALAKAVGAGFVRIPIFVDSVEFYGGIVKPVARECMFYRKSMNAENIKVLADIQVKHTNMLLPNIPIEVSAKTAVECGADAVIVTGAHTGTETPIDLIQRVKKVIDVPVIVGSGVNSLNIDEQLNIADGAIVGSGLKENGVITNPISLEKTKELINAKNGDK